MMITVLSFLIVAFILWVRVAQSDPETWHADPDTVQKTRMPNQHLIRDGADADAEIFDMSATDLAAAFDTMAMAQPKVTRLAGDPDTLTATYIQRTNLMAYPDYISVKFADAGNGKSRLTAYSRSRFGRSDLGVNKARLKSWIKNLRTAS